MRQGKIGAVVCALLAAVMFTGCAPKQRFYSDYTPNYEILENIAVVPEFSEYDGDVEKITLNVTNNGDEIFWTGAFFVLQKKENGEWREISVTGRFQLLAQKFPPTKTVPYIADLKDHVPLPLPSGIYRIGVTTGDVLADDHSGDEVAFSQEFTVK